MKKLYGKNKHFLALLLIISLVLQMGGIFTQNNVLAVGDTEEPNSVEEKKEEPKVIEELKISEEAEITEDSEQHKVESETESTEQSNESEETKSIEEQSENTDKSENSEQLNTEVHKKDKVLEKQVESTKDLGNIFTDVKLTVDGNEISSDSTIEITEGTTVRLDYDWALDDNVNLQAGDWAEISIPDEFVPFKNEDGNLLNNNDEVVGTYHLDQNNKTLRVEFNEVLTNKVQRSGNVWFNFEFDKEEFEEDTSKEVKFNDQTNKTFIITLKPKGNNPSIEKGGKANSEINPSSITWTLDINKALNELKSVNIEDILPAGVELENIKIYDLTIGYNENVTSETLSNKTANDFPINLGDINSAYRIKYTTKITDNSKSSFKNSATITSNNGSKTVESIVGITRGNYIEKKNGKANKNINATEIDWIINVNEAMTEINNAKLKDQLPDGLTIKSDSIKIYKLTFDSNGNEVKGEEVTDKNITDNGNNFEISLGNINEAYQIRFTTEVDYSKVNEGEYKEYNKFINTATLTGEDLENKEDTGEVTLKRDSLLEKSGKATVNYNDKKIKWTIKINKANADIKNAVLTDTIGTGLELIEGTFKVYDSNGNEATSLVPTTPLTNNTFTIDFGNINSSYTIEYETIITDYNQLEFNNKAEFKGNGIGVGDIRKNPTIKPKINNYYEKNRNGIDYDKKEMSWKLNIKPVKEKITELKIEDTFPNNGLVFLENSLIFKGFDKELVKDTDYTITAKDGGYENGFILEFKESVLPLEGKNYSVEYKTSFDPDYENIILNNTKRYINKAHFIGETIYNNVETPIDEEREAHYDINNTANNNGKKEGTISKKDRKVDWKLYLNYMAKEYSEFVVDDEISEGQVIDLDSIVIKEYNVKSGGAIEETNIVLSPNEYEVEKTEKGFKLTFIGGIDRPYLVEYTTNIEGISKQYYSNTATVTGGNTYTANVEYDNYNSFVVKKGEGLENGGTVYTDDIISWKVTINESLSGIEKDSIFTDTISDGLVYINGSLKVYDKDKELMEDTDYTLDINNELPDGETGLKVVFLNEISSKYEIKYDTVVISTEGSVKNNASFSGSKGAAEDNETVTYSATQTSGGTGSGVNKGSILIEKIDGEELDKLLSGAEFELYYMLNGQKRVIGSETTNENGELEFKNLSFRTYYLREIKAPDGYEIGNKEATEIVVDTNKQIKETVENLKKGSLSIKKLDGYTKELLSGAEFELKDSKGELVETLVIDENGEASISNLLRGKYTLQETVAPEGYELDKTVHELEINVENLNLERTIENFMKASISIVKTDGYTEEFLSGAEFEIRDSKGELVKTLATDENGEASIGDLRRGMYTIKETKAPEGYELDDTKHEIELNAENLNYKYEVENFMKASISIVKTDGYTNEALSGAEFEIRDSKDELVKTLVTDGEGKASIGDLRRGMYTIKETKAPKGYELDATVHEIELNAENLNREMPISNYKHGSIVINKVDGDTETSLSGAEFELRNSEGELVKTLVTDKNGQAGIGSLVRGEYTLQEVKAPEGYKLDETKHKVEITSEKLNIELKIENELEDNSMVGGASDENFDNDNKVDSLSDQNEDGLLPQTGEKSSSPYYIIGSLIILIGILLSRKKQLFS